MAKVILILITFSLFGCSGTLLTKKDYQPSLHAYYHNDTKEALKQFPRKEKNAFITDMEKTYLNLLNGKVKLKALQRHERIIQNRVRYVISREIKSMFYAQTAEGYYASEHEIIWMHLLLSWGYSLQKKYEDACVEARDSSYLLSAPWSAEGHFDDPTLRIITAAMWTMCGSWEDAQVDLRVAAALDPSLAWAEKLASLDHPPKNLFIILGGVGPVPEWKPELQDNPLRGARNITFLPQGRRSALQISDGNNRSIVANLSPGSMPWYKRHLIRDNAIHKLIIDSHYGGALVVNSSEEATKVGVAGVYATGLGLASLGVGGALVKIGGSGEIGALGIGIAYLGVKYSINLVSRTIDDSNREFDKDLDPSKKYRFVRYLPEYVWVSWGDKRFKEPFSVEYAHPPKKEVRANLRKYNGLVSNIWIGHYPDVDGQSADPSIWLTKEEKKEIWLKGMHQAINDYGKKNNGWKDLMDSLDQLYGLLGKRKGTFDTLGVEGDYGYVLNGSDIKVEVHTGAFVDEQSFHINLEKRTVDTLSDEYNLLLAQKQSAIVKDLAGKIRDDIDYLKNQKDSSIF